MSDMTRYLHRPAPAFPDPETWTLAHVLRHRAPPSGRTRVPRTARGGVTLDLCRGAGRRRGRWAAAFYAAGADQGDRVVHHGGQLLAARPHLVRRRPSAASSRCRSTPTTRASSCATSSTSPRPGSRSSTTRSPSGGSPSPSTPAWSRSSGSSTPVGHPRQGDRTAAGERLGGRRRGRSSSRREPTTLPVAAAAGPRRDLLHVRHDRPVQGRGDALRPAVLLRPRSSSR